MYICRVLTKYYKNLIISYQIYHTKQEDRSKCFIRSILLLWSVSRLENKGRSIVKSFRLPEDLFKELEDEAAVQETTLNALVCAVLTKYLKHDRYVKRLHYVSVPKKIVELLLETLQEDSMRELAYGFGHGDLRREVDLWSVHTEFDELLNFFAMRVKYAGFGNVYIYRHEDHYTMVIRHTFGEKFSKALAWIFKGFFDSFYEDVEPTYVFADDQLTIRLKKPVLAVKAPREPDLKGVLATSQPRDPDE